MDWDIPIGTEFAGYKVTGVLGRGGMSVVYEAEHLGLGRVVALKVLSPALAADGEFRERFVRESKLAATLDHPNIIPIFDAGESDGRLYIAMRHVEGGDLSSLIKSNAPLGLGQTIFFLEQLAGALDHAHRQGLIHRDVKPANVLIAKPSDRAYLTDFGVVKQASTPALTRTGYFLGTFAYAAPEQIERKPLDGRTDQYALGCLLHECLSGQPPFNADTEASILHAHLSEPPPRLTDSRPDLPLAIDEVVATALAKAKEDRYPTCNELVRALRTVALGSTVGAEVRQPDARPVPETVLSKPDTVAESPPPAAAPPPPSPAAPPAEPLPAEPAGVPASGPPTRAARTFTLSSRQIAAVAAAAVAVIAGAVVAAVLLSGGGSKSNEAKTSATGPAPVVERGVASLVPGALYKLCSQATPVTGASITLSCKPPTATTGNYYPNSWELSFFPSATTLHAAYNDLRTSNDIGTNFGQCNGIQWGGEGKWAHGPGKPGGSRFCYFDGNVAVVVWTHEKLGQPSHIDMLGMARSDGSDHSNLYNWYRFWHHRIGKCEEPNCVAKL